MTASADALAAADLAFHFHPQTNLAAHADAGPMTIARGEGVYVETVDGRRYIEGLSGLWCCALGFSEPRLAEAARRQMSVLPYMHAFAGRSSEPMIRLSEALSRRGPIPGARAFFASSGSEANDTAVKIAWFYNNALGRPQKKRILARDRAYHGVTVVAGSLTGLPHIHAGFDLPRPDLVIRLTCPSLWRSGMQGETEQELSNRLAQELEETIAREGADTIAAMIAEPLIGAGGVLLPPKGYFEAIQPILKRHDILLIADEVITGFGRTGREWGSETYGLAPDILTCAKALTSGYMPLSALLVAPRVYEPVARLSGETGTFGHGFTYSGHPVACAVALETLAIYDERKLTARVAALAPKFAHGLARLAEHPLVGEARSVGLVGCLQFAADRQTKRPFDPDQKIAQRVAHEAQQRGVLLRPIYDTLAFCPPYIIMEAEMEAIFDAVSGALDAVAKSL